MAKKECLKEIKAHDRLKHLLCNHLFHICRRKRRAGRLQCSDGATLYIQKPSNIRGLKKTLTEVLSINWKNGQQQFSKENFLLKAVEVFRRLMRTGTAPLSYRFGRTNMQ